MNPRLAELADNAYALQKWHQGASPADLTAAQASAVAAELMRRPGYTDPRHPDHERLSLMVQELHQRSAPGFVGPSGAVCEGDHPDWSLYR